MSEQFDMIIRNAVLRNNPKEKVDIAIRNGKIAEIAAKVEGKTDQELDAGGNLVTESYVNTHLHLCKVYTLMMMDEAALKDYHGADMGKAMTAIELAAKVKEKYDEKWIIKNVRKASRPGCTLRLYPYPRIRRCGFKRQTGRRQSPHQSPRRIQRHRGYPGRCIRPGRAGARTRR